MNHNQELDLLIHIRQQLIQPRYDNGELSGYLIPAPAVIEQLKTLAAAGITENIISFNGESIAIDKLNDTDNFRRDRSRPVPTAIETTIPIFLYTKNLH